MKKTSFTLPALLGYAGGLVLFAAWIYSGVIPHSLKSGFITNFGQGAFFIMLPAALGVWSAHHSIKSPGVGGLLLVMIGLPGAYLWSQGSVFAIVEHGDGLLLSLLLVAGAMLFVVSGILAIMINKKLG